jgi:phosphoribosyl 1,2-cyclic phosphodiesterase
MRARVWGSRGSLASPGPDTVRYGGNTPCVEVRLDDGSLIVLDAGTGIRKLGLQLLSEPVDTVHLFLTHLHLDHLEGIGFFSGLWDPDVDLHIWGPASLQRTLRERVATLLSEPLFPVHIDNVPRRPVFHDAESEVVIGNATVRSENVAHQGTTVGYRIEENGRSLAYIPDHEPARAGDLRRVASPEWISGHSLAKGADVLLHDSQYTEEEYPSHRGWGHSSIDHVVTFGLIAKVKQLVLYHHDPLHTDDQLLAHERRAKELWGGNDGPVLAREGMEIELPAAVRSKQRTPAAKRA